MEQVIAVTGMGGRFPDALDVAAYWRNLLAGVDSIRWFEPSELRRAGVSERLLSHPDFVPACAPMPEPHAFDHGHFGVTPATACMMDPQQRIMVESAWTALETSGVLARRPGAVGVFVGCSEPTYPSYSPQGHPQDQAEALIAELGSATDYLAARVAFLLDLRGPAITVRTACSTSLVAIHLAVQSLLMGECDAAVAGGAAVRHPLLRGHVYEPGGIYSADGRCRPYDRLGSGIVSGDGVGAVVLRRAEDAAADGDHIHAIIRGSAINSDGAARASFTAPGVLGQAEVALTALEVAGREPRSVGFIEGHGTATQLGDPIEVAALSRAWSVGTGRERRCVLGSVKSGIGHLDAAAGVASFIKACLAVELGWIPPTLNYTEANPHTALEDSPFRVSAKTLEWRDHPRIACVHSIGLGGTNAHVVLEQPPLPRRANMRPTGLPVTLTLSADRREALRPYAEAIGDELIERQLDPATVACTLQIGRSPGRFRRAVVGSSRDELVRALRCVEPVHPVAEAPDLLIVFPGDGRRVSSTFLELQQHLPGVSSVVRDAAEDAKARWGVDLFAAMSGAPTSPAGVLAAAVAQGLALHAAFDTFGVGGDTVLGNSLGEVTAAAAAGLISISDALAISMARESAFRDVSPSGAIAVGAAPETLGRRLRPGLEVAVVNSPCRCVVSGPDEPLGDLARELESDGTPVQRLEVISAVHSSLLDPVLDRFWAATAGIGLAEPARRFVSTVGPTHVNSRSELASDHWVRQLREPVRFDACLRSAVSPDGATVILSLDPARSLNASIHETLGDRARAIISAAPVHDSGDFGLLALASTLGRLWEHGVPIDWEAWPARAASRTMLPVPRLGRDVHELPAAQPDVRSLSESRSIGMWVRTWRQLPPHSGDVPDCGRVTVLGGDRFASELAVRLGELGQEVDLTPSFSPGRIVLDARPLAATDPAAATIEFLTLAADCARRDDPPAGLVVLVSGAFEILGTEEISPAAAAVAACALVVGQEHVRLPVRCLDVKGAEGDVDLICRQAISLVGRDAAITGLRGTHLWRPQVEQLLDASAPGADSFSSAACVITGGLGRFGRSVGRWLAQQGCEDIFLVGRADPSGGHTTTECRRRDEAVAAMRAAGARVQVVSGDAAEESLIFSVLDAAHEAGAGEVAVFHLAGAPHAMSAVRPLLELASVGLASAVAEQWRGKVLGAQALVRWMRTHRDATCVTFSSNASILGGPTLAAYAAANAALDAIAHGAQREGLRWCSLGWDGWRLRDDPPDMRRSALDGYALTNDEPRKALLMATAVNRPHVAVAKGDLAIRHREWVEDATPERPSTWSFGHPEATTGPWGAEDDVLATVRAIWREVLGAAPRTDDSDLFEEGGDSLVAMRIRSRVKTDLRADVTLRDVLSHRTVAGLAALIKQRSRESDKPRATARGKI